MRIVDIEPMILALEKEKAMDDCRGFWYSTVCSIIRLAESLPEIDATERKRGEWQITSAYPHNVHCSECGKRFAQTHWGVWEDGSLPRNFCPNCGADMRGGITF